MRSQRVRFKHFRRDSIQRVCCEPANSLIGVSQLLNQHRHCRRGLVSKNRNRSRGCLTYLAVSAFQAFQQRGYCDLTVLGEIFQSISRSGSDQRVAVLSAFNEKSSRRPTIRSQLARKAAPENKLPLGCRLGFTRLSFERLIGWLSDITQRDKPKAGFIRRFLFY